MGPSFAGSHIHPYIRMSVYFSLLDKLWVLLKATTCVYSHYLHVNYTTHHTSGSEWIHDSISWLLHIFLSCWVLSAFATKQDNRAQCNDTDLCVHFLQVYNLAFLFLSWFKEWGFPTWKLCYWNLLFLFLCYCCFLIGFFFPFHLSGRIKSLGQFVRVRLGAGHA